MPAGTDQTHLLTHQGQMAIADRAEEHSFECNRWRSLPPDFGSGRRRETIVCPTASFVYSGGSVLSSYCVAAGGFFCVSGNRADARPGACGGESALGHVSPDRGILPPQTGHPTG